MLNFFELIITTVANGIEALVGGLANLLIK